MSEEKKKPGADSGTQEEFMEKIKSLEKSLEQIEHSKKQKSMISLIGLVLVLMGIFLFFMNLKSFAEKKKEEETKTNEFKTKMRDNLFDIVKKNTNIQSIEKQLKKEIIPEIYKQVVERFKEDAPKFHKAGKDFATELENYLNNDIKNKLIEKLSESLSEIQVVMKEKYPDIKPEDIKSILEESKLVFIEKMTDVINAHLDYIRTDIDLLKESIQKFKQCEEYKDYDPDDPNTNHFVKIQMVEGMLELILNHLKSQEKIDPLVVEPKSVGGAI